MLRSVLTRVTVIEGPQHYLHHGRQLAGVVRPARDLTVCWVVGSQQFLAQPSHRASFVLPSVEKVRENPVESLKQTEPNFNKTAGR